MKEAYWGYWLVVLGIFVVVIMLLIQNVTSNNSEDYHTVKQISEAAMIDAVDYAYYREYGEVKINKEKFVESFLRRFAEAANLTTEYTVTFTGVYEAPPKVSVEITSNTNTYVISSDSESFDIANRIDAILELNNRDLGNNAQAMAVNCNSNLADTSLQGMHGLSMITNAPIYDAFENTRTGVSTRSAEIGKVFTINGSNGDYWSIEYNGSCGWIESKYMAINLKDYIPNMEYNITNLSGNTDRVYYDGLAAPLDVPGATGVKFYSSEYSSFVPAVYSFAQKLKNANTSARNAGDTLVVYDVYRPNSVSLFERDRIQEMYNSYPLQDRLGSIGNYYASESSHNYGCAIDIAIKNQTGPSPINEMSLRAGNSNAVSNRLKGYMSSAGLSPYDGEWYHFSDSSCRNTIKSKTNASQINFWAINV